MKKHLVILLFSTLAFLTLQAQTTASEWYDNGLGLKKDKKYKEAVESFKKASGIQSNYADAWHQLGWCYNELGMYDEAIDALKKEETSTSSDKASNDFEMGYAYKSIKKYDDALARFNSAIELDNAYALAYKERGNTYFKLKDYEKAIGDFDKYEELAGDVTDEDFYYNKGWAENDLAKYNDAIQSLNKSVGLNSSYTDAYSELGFAYYKLNLNPEAISNYRTAMSLSNEQNRIPIIGIADVYYDNLKNYDSAVIYYEKGTQLKNNSKSAYYRLGWCYNDKSRFSDAVEPLKQAILLDADYTDARTELGYAYYKLEKYDDALAQFRPIMNKDSKNELSRYYAGFCYYLKNDQENLKKMIDQLTALNSTTYVETLKKYVK